VISAALLGCAASPHTSIGTSSPTPTFVYTGNNTGQVISSSSAGNEYGGNLSGYSVDSTSGALTPLSGFPLSLKGVATSGLFVTHDPQNRFLIVVDTVGIAIHVLTINATTGALAEVPASPFVQLDAPPTSAVTDPTGQFLYVSNHVSAMQAFNLSSAGALTPVPGGMVPLEGKAFLSATSINALHISADGRFLYYANGSQLIVYSVNLSNGTIATLQNIVGGPTNVRGGFVFDPAGKYLYALGNGSTNLVTYAIDPTTGLLTQAATTTLLVETVGGNSTLTISPNGKFAYTIENGNTLVSYAVSNGVFTPIGTPLTGFSSAQLVVDATGSFLYAPVSCLDCVPATASGIDQFAIGSDGLLTPLSPAIVPSSALPFDVTMVSL
jgi:6-phosphogluconolactonase (cycloisomerase 2 family)